MRSLVRPLLRGPRSVRPRSLVAAGLLILFATPAWAQGWYGVPVLNELSVGVGGGHDGRPTAAQMSLRFSAAMVDSGDDYWPYRAGYMFRAEVGGPSQTVICQQGALLAEDEVNCADVVVLVGLHINPVRRAHRRIVPFIEVLTGRAWKGSGLKAPEFLSDHATLQVGGGVDLRGLDSKHKIRLSLDYRHLFAGGGSQVHLAASYVWGPR